LSLGCGIGDTELLLARQVGEVVGVDLSPAAVRQARADAERLHASNVTFLEGTAPPAGDRFDAIIAIFLLHHLPERTLSELPVRVLEMLKPRGVFYSLDPSVRRLSGALGRLLVPELMKKHQSPDERELDAEATAELFRRPGLVVRGEMYDFASTPLGGLLPSWRLGYRIARRADDVLLRVPMLRRRGSNFEIVARKPWPGG
jgi:SAM-dependent methyltransferase